ncbi:methyltransferase [Streptomyces yaizuensis]|uniref:Methyltransferase n=1 Tax=Streptomyces yaizuensis TaxID=2989713 RepID=A0ABQ5P969_9ACTN|nr:methyltransferase [Streptomyces sp. YSPA8]GLF99144.1 methyltransferase [Streptomyces sp. YSPA8]
MTRPDEETAAAVPMDPALQQLALGYVPAQILWTAAELGIADGLADGPLAAGPLAERTGTDPAALRRLLRALAGLGLVTQLDTERFALTDLGRQLRSGGPGSPREQIGLTIAPELWQAWGALTRTVRTGETHRIPGTGLTAHEALRRHPGLSARLHAGKAQATAAFAPGVPAAYDFSGFGTVVDLGGGDDGTLIAAVLTAVPALRAVLVDRQEPLDRTAAALAGTGLADRWTAVADDPATAVPPGGDAYLLNNVVRDWDDRQALAVLRRCRAAMPPQARLLLVETLMPDVLTPEESAAYGLTDLNNLVFAGGRERTRDEYGRLLADSGFTLTSAVAVKVADGVPDYHVIEGTPAG